MIDSNDYYSKDILSHELLQDNLTIEQAENLQDKWMNFDRNEENLNLKKLKWVVGVDISFPPVANPAWGVACAVLWDYQKNELYDHSFFTGELPFPYTPGFLGFRESRLMAQAIIKLPEKPEVIMCDGHGIVHPKRFGEAVQLGIALNTPSFGVAKNPFVGYSDWKSIIRSKGNKIQILAEVPNSHSNDSPETLGNAVCLTPNCKPVFISKGFNISLESAVRIALYTSKVHRQPEPLFFADSLSRRKIEEINQS